MNDKISIIKGAEIIHLNGEGTKPFLENGRWHKNIDLCEDVLTLFRFSRYIRKTAPPIQFRKLVK